MYFISKTVIASSILIFATTMLQAQDNLAQKNNPLLQKSNLQYQAPVFNLIKNEHFKPAFDIALKLHDAEIEKIANNPAKPTFENTVQALEISGQDLIRATLIFDNLKGSNTNPFLQK